MPLRLQTQPQQLQLTDSGRWLKFRFTVFASVDAPRQWGSRKVPILDVKKVKHDAQEIINLHSYQSIKRFYFISLFSPNQSYQKVVITRIANMKPVSLSDWHQISATLTQIGYVYVPSRFICIRITSGALKRKKKTGSLTCLPLDQ